MSWIRLEKAQVEYPNLFDEVIWRITRPAMVKVATAKYTHGPEWLRLPYRPDFEEIECIRIPGDSSLKPRRQGILGLIDSFGISFGDWPNKFILTPDRMDLPWHYYYREGLNDVLKCRLGFVGLQSVIEGNESYEAFGKYVDESLVNFSVSESVPRSFMADQIPLI